MGYPLDFDAYTYAISFGYTIEELYKQEYLFMEKSNVGDYHFGEVFAVLLQDSMGDQLHLYRMEKDWVDIKYYAQYDGNYRLK